MSEHAPGPWRAGEPDGRGHVLVTCQFGDVADVIAGPSTARLIAAAPTLLDDRHDLLALARKLATEWCGVRRVSNEPCRRWRDGECLPCWAQALVRRIEGTPPP